MAVGLVARPVGSPAGHGLVPAAGELGGPPPGPGPPRRRWCLPEPATRVCFSDPSGLRNPKGLSVVVEKAAETRQQPAPPTGGFPRCAVRPIAGVPQPVGFLVVTNQSTPGRRLHPAGRNPPRQCVQAGQQLVHQKGMNLSQYRTAPCGRLLVGLEEASLEGTAGGQHLGALAVGRCAARPRRAMPVAMWAWGRVRSAARARQPERAGALFGGHRLGGTIQPPSFCRTDSSQSSPFFTGHRRPNRP